MHGIGTSKAIDMGGKEGAASGLTMDLTGVITVRLVSITVIFL
ncbi:MAG: LrgB family protein [Acidaminobacteraceae bacterium]